MDMQLSELLAAARASGFAVGHFNVANLEMLRAIVGAAKESGVLGIMIGTSEGERDAIGLKQAVALIGAFKEEYTTHLFLNADHTKSMESCRAAIDAGYPSVHFDGSALPFEENVAKTEEVVEYARKKAGSRKDKTGSMSIEGELGYLGGGSTVTRERVTILAEQMTDPDQARKYVERTGVDRLAVAIGNVHGLNLEEPQLDFERLKAIRAAVPERCALVLHAGSGIADEDIRRAISLGVANIHISTELRKAWREAIELILEAQPDEYAPHKISLPVIDTIKSVVVKKLELFEGRYA